MGLVYIMQHDDCAVNSANRGEVHSRMITVPDNGRDAFALFGRDDKRRCLVRLPWDTVM